MLETTKTILWIFTALAYVSLCVAIVPRRKGGLTLLAYAMIATGMSVVVVAALAPAWVPG